MPGDNSRALTVCTMFVRTTLHLQCGRGLPILFVESGQCRREDGTEKRFLSIFKNRGCRLFFVAGDFECVCACLCKGTVSVHRCVSRVISRLAAARSFLALDRDTREIS